MNIDNIRERLKKTGKSQNYLAKLAGVSKSSLEKFLRAETKAPHERTLKKYDDALNKLKARGEILPPRDNIDLDHPQEYAVHNVVDFKHVARQVDQAFTLISEGGKDMVQLFQEIINLLQSDMKDDLIRDVKNLTFIMEHRKQDCPSENGTEGTQ